MHVCCQAYDQQSTKKAIQILDKSKMTILIFIGCLNYCCRKPQGDLKASIWLTTDLLTTLITKFGKWFAHVEFSNTQRLKSDVSVEHFLLRNQDAENTGS